MPHQPHLHPAGSSVFGHVGQRLLDDAKEGDFQHRWEADIAVRHDEARLETLVQLIPGYVFAQGRPQAKLV